MLNVSSSNSQEAKVPELRFPEFSDNWETVALSDFTERVTRKNVNNESNLPLTISSKDGLVDQISYFNKAVASRNMSGYYLLQNGEFAYNKSYSVGYDFGSIKRLDKYPKGALSTLYICFALKKYDSDFIKIYFDSLKWYREIFMIAAEGARNHGLLNVSADAFFATKHILPQNEKEQEKIAAFMVLLGKKVVLQQQLVDALKLYKRGALSRLFPKNGASVPEYHFSGFTDDWEQRKVSELCSISTGKSNTQDKVEDGEYPFYVRSPIIERSKKYLYDEEAVLTVGDGVGTGKVFHYVNGKYDLHQRCYRMYGFTKELNAHYFYHVFSKLFYKRVMAMTAKTSVDSVRLEMIADMEIPCPNINEQEKIGGTIPKFV